MASAADACSSSPPGIGHAHADDDRLRHEIAALIPALNCYARVLKRNGTEADDLVQDCLCRALAKIHLWQRGTDLRAWIFTILHNQHVNELRRSTRWLSAIAPDDIAEERSVPSDAMSVLRMRDLERAIRRLPEAYRRAVVLVGLEDQNYASAATALRIPIGTLRSRLFRAREALRNWMEMDAAPLPVGTSGSDALPLRHLAPSGQRRRGNRAQGSGSRPNRYASMPARPTSSQRLH